MTDGIITRAEEERLSAFRDHFALENDAADQGALAELGQSSGDRIMMEAKLATVSVQDGDGHPGTSPSPSGRQASTKVKPTGSSSGPGRQPWRGHWRPYKASSP